MARRCPTFRKKKGQENLFPEVHDVAANRLTAQYWFPTYTRADDTLHFPLEDVHIREIIKYENYKRFGSKSRITYEGQEVPKADDRAGADQKPAEPPKPQRSRQLSHQPQPSMARHA